MKSGSVSSDDNRIAKALGRKDDDESEDHDQTRVKRLCNQKYGTFKKSAPPPQTCEDQPS